MRDDAFLRLCGRRHVAGEDGEMIHADAALSKPKALLRSARATGVSPSTD